MNVRNKQIVTIVSFVFKISFCNIGAETGVISNVTIKDISMKP